MIDGLFEPAHLIIILVIVLIIFGPGKLPELGSALGRGIKEFRGGMQEPAEPPAAPPMTAAQATAPVVESAPRAAAIVCPSCGAALASDVHFCGQCGNPVTPAA